MDERTRHGGKNRLVLSRFRRGQAHALWQNLERSKPVIPELLGAGWLHARQRPFSPSTFSPRLPSFCLRRDRGRKKRERRCRNKRFFDARRHLLAEREQKKM